MGFIAFFIVVALLIFSSVTGLLGGENAWLFDSDLSLGLRLLFFIPGGLIVLWIIAILFDHNNWR